MSNPSSLPIQSIDPLLRTLAVAGLAVLAAAALVACEPAVPGAQAAAAGIAEPRSVAVARVLQSSLDGTATQVARVDASQRPAEVIERRA